MALPVLRSRTPRPPVSRARVRTAWVIALGADFLQIVLAPVFGPGFASVFDDALDVFVAVALSLLLGWHWEFVPGFLVKLVPFVDLVPTWTIACWLATRGRARKDDVPATIPPPTSPAA